MVAFMIYWFSILVNIAWVVISVGFSIWYLSNKENGNLWAFAFLNVLAIIFLAVILLVYNTWDFEVAKQSTLIIGIIITNVVVTVLQAFLGREPKIAIAK